MLNSSKTGIQVLSTALALAGVSVAQGNQQHNILFIAVDDLRPALGCYGDPHAITPNIDALAERGTIFTNAHCQQAVCAPSRISLLTGLRPDTTQVWDLKTRFRERMPDAVTLPQHLRAAGYTTAGVGKIFDPRSTDAEFDGVSWTLPMQHYVDSLAGQTFNYLDPEYVDLAREKRAEAEAMGLRDWSAQRAHVGMIPTTDEADVPDDAYEDGQTAAVAIGFIEELAPKDEPFFIAVGFRKPHLPFNAPSRYWDMYDRAQFASKPPTDSLPEGAPDLHFQDSWELRSGYTEFSEPGTPVPDEDRMRLTHGYYACVSYIDQLIGDVVEALEASGEADDTVIVLWGDHGFTLGEHGMYCKHTNYELATRVPLLFVAPDAEDSGIKRGNEHAGPVELIDVFPTLSDLASFEAPETLHGVSLTAAMRDPASDVKPIAISQYDRRPAGEYLMGYAARDRRYRYIEWRVAGARLGPGTGDVVARELYDYQLDPQETISFANDPAYGGVIKRMSRLLRDAGVGQSTGDSGSASRTGPRPIDAEVPELRWRDPDAQRVYKQTREGDLRFDIFKPEGWSASDERPAIVLFHGGGWVNGKTQALRWQALFFASKGMVAICPEYRIRNTHGTRALQSVLDARDAMRYVRANADEFGIDRSRIVAGGGSAGAHVAACTTMIDELPGDTDSTVPSDAAALVLFCPVLDTTTGFATHMRLGIEPRAISPLHHIDGALPPTIIFQGDADETTPVDRAQQFERDAAQRGRDCELVLYPGRGHSFFHRNRSDGQDFADTLARAERFLRERGILR
ncbi:MAG: sulfatase-like hydrolase/transferase [Planctomycetota bacterium]